jgi:hypothetical protein
MTLSSVPKSAITGPAAWMGKDMEKDSTIWLRHLSTGNITELENAAEHYLTLNKDVGEIAKLDFPLGEFAASLEELRHKLLYGVGVEVLHGLSIKQYSQKFIATIFCGIGAHLGKTRSQNAQGHTLGHVRDIGVDAQAENTRIYQTSVRQGFHTDSADVVGLLCLQNAKQGGRSLLVSGVSIFNRMLEERPDLVVLLFDPIATDRRGEIPEGAKAFTSIPPLSWYQNYLTVFYHRDYINRAQRLAGAFHLTDAHVEALDMFDALANDSEFHFSMDLEPGDMQFVYNHSQLHDRMAFVDWPDPEQRRHLLRLWLSIPGDRHLPEIFKERYGSIEIGNRGGIMLKDTVLNAPLD